MDQYDEIKRWCLVIKLSCVELQELATAFYRTGNEAMYIKLSDLSYRMGDAQSKINNIMRDMLHQDYEDMQSSIGKALSVMANKGETDE